MKLEHVARANELRERLRKFDQARFDLQWGRDNLGEPIVSIRIDKSGDNIKNTVLSEIGMEKKYVDYFLFQECTRLTNALRALGVDDVPDVIAEAITIPSRKSW